MLDRSFLRALLLVGLISGTGLAQADGLFAQSKPRFLPAHEAFVLDAMALEADAIEVRWSIAPGYYLYQHRLAIEAVQPADLALDWRAPPGRKFTDEHFGPVEIYQQQLSLPVALSTSATTVTLKIQYQGCAEAGLCYPPQERHLTVDLPARP